MPHSHYCPLSPAVALASPGLSSLVAHARFLESIDNLVRATLPDPLRTHVTVANLEGESLVMLADSPAWATRLRYHRESILQTLWQAHSIRCRTFEVKVQTGP